MAAILALSSVLMTACGGNAEPVDTFKDESVIKKPTYMIYYGKVDDVVVENAKQYDIAILHPKAGDVTREQVAEIQSAGTLVFGYIAVGEDLRTSGMTAEEMKQDERFTADGTGPRIDPRPMGEEAVSEGEESEQSAAADPWLVLDNVDIAGLPSPGGSGYASYYLDDVDRDGKPDFNPVFFCAYTNIGDPAWFEVLDSMTVDGDDGVPGMKEILTTDYGRGLGCDGLFLDTIDTCAPNAYTSDDDPSRTRFEWTSVGAADFMAKIKRQYPDKLICQNRGLFFYNPVLPQYRYTPRASVDYLMYESYMLDSNTDHLYNDSYFADNKYAVQPKLMAEANRPDGFTVLSLGYAEGPEEYHLQDTLLGQSSDGLDILLSDLKEADDLAGFSHYITGGDLTVLNDFVLTHRSEEDSEPPVWSSVYNDSTEWPPRTPAPRVGIAKAEAVQGGAIVTWDMALDKNAVVYRLYYSEEPFDFAADPNLVNARWVTLTPEVGTDYGHGYLDTVYPYQARIDGLEWGKTYYFVIRAHDASENHNQEKNTVFRTAKIL